MGSDVEQANARLTAAQEDAIKCMSAAALDGNGAWARMALDRLQTELDAVRAERDEARAQIGDVRASISAHKIRVATDERDAAIDRAERAEAALAEVRDAARDNDAAQEDREKALRMSENGDRYDSAWWNAALDRAVVTERRYQRVLAALPADLAAEHDRRVRAEALEAARGLDTETRVRFYEHDFYVLSNFSAFPIRWPANGSGAYDEPFPTSEHVYHWEKLRYSDNDAARLIRTGNLSVHDAFKIGQSGKRREDWDTVKVDVMREILRAKVSQHEYVKRKLLATGDRELVEDSWRDDFWGWGPERTGQNMLGKLWMEVRAEIRARAAEERGGR